MSGFWPLVVLAGQTEQVGSRRLELLKINLGDVLTTIVFGDFAYERTLMKVESLIGKIDVLNITGGVEGDLLILLAEPLGDEVKLKATGGNLLLNSGDMKLRDTASITLLKEASNWRELGRSE